MSMTKTEAMEVINKFNEQFPVGSEVQWRSVAHDKHPYEVCTVTHPAYLLNHTQPVAWVKERSGCISVESRFVKYDGNN